MKEKVMVRINIPFANLAYDMKIPCDLSVGTASQVISDIIKSIGDDEIPFSTMPVLWNSDTGTILDQSKTIREIGTKDGDCFILF